MKTIIPLFILAVLIVLSPKVGAVVPAPDGGYPNFNTAEGANALFSLTTGYYNTANGFHALYHNTTGSYNTATGFEALLRNTTGGVNTAIGDSALFSNTTGNFNTAIGGNVLLLNTIGHHNTAIGEEALLLNTTGNNNTANGVYALRNTTGGSNIALGSNAGINLTTGSNNIDIGNVGVAAEARTVRIGTSGNQTRAFIAGIRGVTTVNANAVPVVIDSDGQLGTVSSSRRLKHEIKPMDKASEAILALKPVTFHYKSDNAGTPQYGLIAEEVAAVNPDLVVRDENGEIYTVRYDAVNAMLLNEFLKEHCTVQEQGDTITELKKEIESLTTTVKKQAAQIQKVSAQMGIHKPGARIALSNP